jgi:hypothetical protein
MRQNQLKPEEHHNIFRLDIQPDNRKSGTHGYQVRIETYQDKRRKLFSDSVSGSKEQALRDAIQWRDDQLREMGVIDNRSRVSITLPISNTSGIIGISRTERIEPSSLVREHWQTTYVSPDQQVKNKKFDIRRYGEIGALRETVNARMEALSDLIGVEAFKVSETNIRCLTDHYLNILVYLEELTPAEEEIFLNTVLSKEIPNTTKEDIIKSRVGQKTYKQKLSVIWGGACAITQSKLLVNASHIKPWSSSSDEERMDPYNGILLSPVYDRAFDKGYITFDSHGALIVASQFADDLKKIGIKGSEALKSISPFNLKYLDYHREHIFKAAGERCPA